jgi:hypothetical protein
MPDATILLKIAAISEGVPLSRLNLRIFAGGRQLGTEVALSVDWQKVAISMILGRFRGAKDGMRVMRPQEEGAGTPGENQSSRGRTASGSLI